MGSEEKKKRKKEHAFFPFQTCSFTNVFKRLNASTNTFITFYDCDSVIGHVELNVDLVNSRKAACAHSQLT